jgi:transposase-like protein
MAELSAGRSVGEVARRHRVREQTLIWWRSELKRRARAVVPPQRLLPVVLSGSSNVIGQQASGGVDVVLETRRGTLRLRGNIDLHQLGALVSAVRV